MEEKYAFTYRLFPNIYFINEYNFQKPLNAFVSISVINHHKILCHKKFLEYMFSC